MKKEKIKIVKVKEEYLDYLRKFDSNVQYNKSELNKSNKPFIGVLFKLNNCNYYVPISSAKNKEKIKKFFEKSKKINRTPIDIVFIKDEKENLLSVLNLNNMVPINEKAIINYDIKFDTNSSLLIKEYKYCNKNIKEIREKCKKIYNIVKQHRNDAIESRCCKFKLLEIKCKEYDKYLELSNKNDIIINIYK